MPHHDSEAVNLFARHYFEGANQHSLIVNKSIDNHIIMPINDFCYHAGACIEMLIYGSIIKTNLFDYLYNKEEKDREILENLNRNKPYIGQLLTLDTAPIGRLLPIFLKENSSSGSITSGIGLLFHRLLTARNNVVHRDFSNETLKETQTLFIFARDYVRRQYGNTSDEYKCLDGTLEVIEPAMHILLNMQIANAANCIKNYNIETLKSNYSEIASNLNREYCNLRQEKQRTGSNFFEHNTSIVKCPACQFPAFLTKQYDGYATAWVHEPNNSISILAGYKTNGKNHRIEDIRLACPMCDLKWGRIELLVLHKPLATLIPEKPSSALKQGKREIYNLLSETLKHG